ncbi:hypothetical protein [Mesorhizobium sp.]|nr:hypothetical protein [Mesorhizobium sp.]
MNHDLEDVSSGPAASRHDARACRPNGGAISALEPINSRARPDVN